MNDTLNAETYVIGAICQDQGVIRLIAPYLRTEDFLIKPCAVVFDAAMQADSNGKLFDGYIAADILKGKIDNPRQFVADCINLCATTANAEEYAKLIRWESDERVLREKVSAALSEEHGNKLTETIAAICNEQIQAMPRGRMKPLKEVLNRTYDGLFEKPTNRIDTGYGKLDYLLKGMWGGELIIVAARPAVGKSAFALSLAENAARRKKVVQFYSLEMEDIEIAERILSRWTSEVTMNDIIDRGFGEDEAKNTDLAQSVVKTAELPILIDDSANVKPSKIRVQALTQKELGLIVVDYGGLMSADRKYDSRNLELGAISRDLKNLAKELHIPIIMIAQLNRGVGDDTKPSLRELRDSGELEQNANKCIFLWNIDKENGKVGVSVAKNRKGKCGEVVMHFDGDHMRFSELEERYEEPKPSRGNRRGGNDEIYGSGY